MEETMALSREQIEAYDRDGFLVVEDVLSADEIAELRRVTDEMVDKSLTVTAHNDIYDIEPNHSAAAPRIRRIKSPDKAHPAYDRVMRHEKILAILRDLVSPAIRFDSGKLNMKEPGGGAAVEWHQDWAFYPHTNADLCAVGIMMDDCALENGPLLCIPGSHKGPVYDHHNAGVFGGAIDPDESGIDFSKAVPCTGKAGSISIHHAITVHGSAVNTSNRSRRLLLNQYRAADSWPLAALHQAKSWEDWEALMLCGETNSTMPRLEPVEVRLPLPQPATRGSIFEVQKAMKKGYFNTPARAAT
jgi:ectoine hydroxylase-related dioxygenase (phytanoyl-CoA dioxygenase family)